MTDRRSAWVIVFSVSTFSYAVIAAFASSWANLLFTVPPAIAALASFGYLYNQGKGIPETTDAPRRIDG